MKKICLMLALSLCVLTLCACGEKPQSPEVSAEAPTEAPTEAQTEAPVGAPAVGIANPLRVVTADEQLQACGLMLAPPEGAENAVYKTISSGDSPVLAETDFTLDGVEYYYRAIPTAELESYDISGLYYDWGEAQQLSVKYCDAKLYASDQAAFVMWLDIVPGINYNLCCPQACDLDVLAAIANEIFLPVQGEASGE